MKEINKKQEKPKTKVILEFNNEESARKFCSELGLNIIQSKNNISLTNINDFIDLCREISNFERKS